jgi:Zn-dependent peptidase ImmA (M78 family)
VVSPREVPGLEGRFVRQLVVDDHTSWSAVTFTVGGLTVIICNSEHSDPRHESSVMHELSHVILRHKPAVIDAETWFPLRLREYRAAEEAEANWLGGCLQLPRKGLVWALSQGMSQLQIALHFRASREMVRYRCNVTGVNRQLRSRASTAR